MAIAAAVRKRRVLRQADARTTSQAPMNPMIDRHSLTHRAIISTNTPLSAAATSSSSKVTKVVTGEPTTVFVNLSDARLTTNTPAPSTQSYSPDRLSSSSNPGSKATRISSTPAATAVVTGDATTSADPVNKTPIIVGVVVGVLFITIALWLVWFCVRRRKKRIRDEATKHEQEHWLPGHGYPGSDQSLGIYSSSHYSAALDASDTARNKQISSGLGSRESGKKRPPYSPRSFVFPSKHDGSVPSSESSPDSGGLFPSSTIPSELSAESSPKAELSPNPEALEINRSRPPDQKTPTTGGHPSPRRPPEATEMRPNLEISDDEDRRRGSHVMSWMSSEQQDRAQGPSLPRSPSAFSGCIAEFGAVGQGRLQPYKHAYRYLPTCGLQMISCLSTNYRLLTSGGSPASRDAPNLRTKYNRQRRTEPRASDCKAWCSPWASSFSALNTLLKTPGHTANGITRLWSLE
ncbi:MAG: hypothetical protein Q9213_007776 [Squamulea squamosa]